MQKKKHQQHTSPLLHVHEITIRLLAAQRSGGWIVRAKKLRKHKEVSKSERGAVKKRLAKAARNFHGSQDHIHLLLRIGEHRSKTNTNVGRRAVGGVRHAGLRRGRHRSAEAGVSWPSRTSPSFSGRSTPSRRRGVPAAPWAPA